MVCFFLTTIPPVEELVKCILEMQPGKLFLSSPLPPITSMGFAWSDHTNQLSWILRIWTLCLTKTVNNQASPEQKYPFYISLLGSSITHSHPKNCNILLKYKKNFLTF